MATTTSHLATKAMLISVSISQYGAKKLDKRISEEVTRSHNTEAGRLRTNKRLLDKDVMRPVQSAVTAIRSFYYEQTLPWGKDGARILPASNYFGFTSVMRNLIDAFDRTVEDFIFHYPDYVVEARAALNGAFNPEDYPPVEKLRKRFGVTVDVLPLPDAGDFRIDLGQDEVRRIKEDIETKVEASFKEAMDDLWKRVFDGVSRMKERLDALTASENDPDRRLAPLHNSVVENLRALVDLLPRLNVTQDANLEAMRRKIDAELARYDVEALKEDKVLRTKVLKSTDDILEAMEAFMA